MLFNNLPLSLPWYSRIFLQDRFRNHVSKDVVFAQLAPFDGLLPFQFNKISTSELPAHWKIKCVGDATLEDYLGGHEDDVAMDISTLIATNLQWGSFVEDSTVKDWFMFKNSGNVTGINTISPFGLEPGLYYMEMKFPDSVNTDGIALDTFDGLYVSEIFRVPEEKFTWNNASNECKFVALKWYHNSPIKPNIVYPGDGSFFNLLYMDSFIAASEPEVEIEGEKDGNNELIPTSQKASIKYTFSALVPDFVKVALYAMEIHDFKELTTEYGFRKGELKNMAVSHEETSDQAYSVVILSFEQMALLTTTSCAGTLIEPEETTLDGGQAISVDFCSGSGGVVVRCPTGFAAGFYAKLWGKIAGVWTEVAGYVPREAVSHSPWWIGTIDTGLAITKFKLTYHTFYYDTGVESAEATPTITC